MKKILKFISAVINTVKRVMEAPYDVYLFWESCGYPHSRS